MKENNKILLIKEKRSCMYIGDDAGKLNLESSDNLDEEDVPNICKQNELNKNNDIAKKYYESLFKKKINEYKKSFRHFLLTSRFNNATWNENVIYREKNQHIKCIYCSPDQVSKNIPKDSILFILEMNNDINKIIGIGMVRNHPIMQKFLVYNEGNYNRYVYIGKIRIDRSQMSIEEDRIMKVFDILCFTGNKHMKRGQGLKSFPIDMLYNCSVRIDLVKFISEMFKKRISKK